MLLLLLLLLLLLPTQVRAELQASVNQVLADLHSVDYKAVGLDGSDGHPLGPFGKVVRERFCVSYLCEIFIVGVA